MGIARESRLSRSKQDQLTEHFVAGTTARTAAALCGVNRKTAAYFLYRPREIIAYEMESEADAVFEAAMAEAAEGKGRDRHASGEPFERQPMMAITAMVGVGFPLGQAQKKAQEAARFATAGDVDCARAEILGGINYFAGALIALEGRR